MGAAGHFAFKKSRCDRGHQTSGSLVRTKRKEDDSPRRIAARRSESLTHGELGLSVRGGRSTGIALAKDAIPRPVVLRTGTRHHDTHPMREGDEVQARFQPQSVLSCRPVAPRDRLPGQVENVAWAHLVKQCPTLAKLQ